MNVTYPDTLGIVSSAVNAVLDDYAANGVFGQMLQSDMDDLRSDIADAICSAMTRGAQEFLAQFDGNSSTKPASNQLQVINGGKGGAA